MAHRCILILIKLHRHFENACWVSENVLNEVLRQLLKERCSDMFLIDELQVDSADQLYDANRRNRVLTVFRHKLKTVVHAPLIEMYQ